eukprot:g3913.t1
MKKKPESGGQLGPKNSSKTSSLGKRRSVDSESNETNVTTRHKTRKHKYTNQQVALLKSEITKLRNENKKLKTDDRNGAFSSSGSSKSSNSTTSSSEEASEYSVDDKEFYNYSHGNVFNENKKLLVVHSLTPKVVSWDKNNPDYRDKNLLVAVDMDGSTVPCKKPEFIGILEKIATKKNGEKKSSGSCFSVEERRRVEMFYHETTKSIFFSITVNSFTVGLYKFTLKLNTENGLVESNSLDFSITSSEDNMKKDKNDNKDNDDTGKDDQNDGNFDDYDNFDSYDRDFNGDGNGGNDLFGDDFSAADLDMMFDNFNADPCNNRYFITESYGWHEDSPDEMVHMSHDVAPHCSDNDASNENGDVHAVMEESSVSYSRRNTQTNGNETDDEGAEEADKPFTAIPIRKESAGKRLMNAPKYLIVLFLALILVPSLQRAKSHGRDPVLKYGSLMVEHLGLTKMSINACSLLASTDCSQHVKYISTVPEYQKSDFYPVEREPIPYFSSVAKSILEILFVTYVFCYVVLFPDCYYERDRFGYSASFFIGTLEIVRVYFDGYPLVFAVPMLGPLMFFFVFEKYLLPKFATKEIYGRYRSSYITVTIFIFYLWFLPLREWVVANYGIVDNTGTRVTKLLPPSTILYSLPTQKVFSQGAPMIILTQNFKSPLNWIVYVAGLSFILALASSFARTYNDGTENMNSFIITLFQIYPYYVSPLLFTGSCMTLIKPLTKLVRVKYEEYSGRVWDRPANFIA